ncbi:xanthine dehydrogenase, small subunit [Methylocaldum marinum]|uniref:Xanthine dehydrogenase, small subunit n=1 Tax=Methylocaldum marinum TaxID=1432792 RepID=A0A286T5M6_9GAMM|nr:xanthine dehydrogenase, small subunit [Methylocaldum marinum]
MTGAIDGLCTAGMDSSLISIGSTAAWTITAPSMPAVRIPQYRSTLKTPVERRLGGKAAAHMMLPHQQKCN